MFIIAKKLREYDKDCIRYYINSPKISYKEDNDTRKNKMIDNINKIVCEDINNFIEISGCSYGELDKHITCMSSLVEYKVGYISEDILSLAIEFSQLSSIYDISYIKGYNYDLGLDKQIDLKDLFLEKVDFLSILRKHVLDQYKVFISEMEDNKDSHLYDIESDDIYMDEDNCFYFDKEYLILPFSSCEIDVDILNLLEFKIPFQNIYNYLSNYALKNILNQ